MIDEMKSLGRPGLFCFDPEVRLNAHAEFGGLALVAGVRVEVARSAALELVAQAQLAAYVDSEGGDADRYGRPSTRAQGNAGFSA
jgi:hypothetical protein